MIHKEDFLLGKGSLTLIGPKDDLKMLNYRADDPETFIKQLGAASSTFENAAKSGKSGG